MRKFIFIHFYALWWVLEVKVPQKQNFWIGLMFMVGGAFACECDADGSLDHYNCNSFGGQCQC